MHVAQKLFQSWLTDFKHLQCLDNSTCQLCLLVKRNICACLQLSQDVILLGKTETAWTWGRAQPQPIDTGRGGFFPHNFLFNQLHSSAWSAQQRGRAMKSAVLICVLLLSCMYLSQAQGKFTLQIVLYAVLLHCCSHPSYLDFTRARLGGMRDAAQWFTGNEDF